MGNLLDKLFKEKLTTREIEYDSQQWEAMEALLDQQPLSSTQTDHTNSTFPYLRYLIGFVAIALVGYGLNLSFKSDQIEDKQSKERVEVLDKAYAQQQAENASYQESKTEHVQSESNRSVANPDDNIRNQSVKHSESKSESISSFEDNIAGTESTLENIVENQNFNTKSKSVFNQHNDNYPTNDQSALETKVRTSQSSPIGSQVGSQIGQTGIKSTSDVNNNTQISSTNQLMSSMAYLSYLDLNTLSYQRNLPQVAWADSGTKIQEVVDLPRRPSMGIYAAYELIEGGNSYNVGVFKSLALANKWSLTIEPGYSKYQLGGDSIAREVSEFFSFGSVPFEQNIVSDEMHTVQLPILLEYHLGNISFGSGLIYEHVLAMRADKITKIDGEISEEEQIWLDPVFYNSSLIRSRFSMNYNLTSHLNAGVNYEIPLTPKSSFNNVYSLGFVLKYSI